MISFLFSLNRCCEIHNIELKHHDALSDARACAKLYLIAQLLHRLYMP